MKSRILVGLVALVTTLSTAHAGKNDKVKETPPKGKAAAAAKGKADARPKVEAKSYEELRASASDAGDLANLLEPLVAECGQKDDLSKRQCTLIRQWHLERLHGRKWVAVADATALQNQPYDATEKTLTLTVTGCLACKNPPVVGGVARLVATKAPKAFEDGAPVGLDLGTHDVAQPDAKEAAFWMEKVRPRLRVEFVFGVGETFDSKAGKGVAVNVVGHRVYNTCNGEVIASQPESTDKLVKLSGPRDPVCPAADSPSDKDIEYAKRQATLPETLTREDIQKAMAPVQQRIYECGEEFELKQGTARIKLSIPGDGKGRKIDILPPYDKGDVHLCLRAALNEAKFPLFKDSSPVVNVDYPFVLRR